MTEYLPHNPEDMSGERVTIETHRSLIDVETRIHSGISEYFDTHERQRILAIPQNSESAQLHWQLAEHRVPVYPALETQDSGVYLKVPNDARSIQSSVRFIARDIIEYKDIFTQIGTLMGRCAVSGFGLPVRGETRSLLSSIAYSLDDTEAFGGNVYLLPPYNLDAAKTKNEELKDLGAELMMSRHISIDIAKQLVTAASIGWENARK